MRSESNEPVDERLRGAFAVNEAAAARVAAAALAANREGAGLRRLTLRASMACAALVVSAGLTWWVFGATRTPEPREPAAAEATVEVRASFVDGVLIVPIPDASIVIAGPHRRDNRPADGSGMAFVEGDDR